MKYFIITENTLKACAINMIDLKIYNKKYSLFISILEKLVNNDRIIYLLKSKNILDRIKGMNLSRKYYKMVVI